MGLLIDGQWHDHWYDTESTDGRFERKESQYRNWITADGSAGPSGEGGFPAESGRYHLYVSYACPWAHRTLIMRAWKGLEQHISVSSVHPFMLENGWEFRTDFDAADGDPLYGLTKLYELYQKADPKYTGRVTVPTLWDKQRQTIVNNESSEIIRMLTHAFDGVGAKPGDYYPEDLRSQIDEANELIYPRVNNGVYKAGFATEHGDTVAVSVNVVEGSRKRIQVYEGVVIAKRNRGLGSSFTVRKISSGVGVERTFQTYSPLIAGIEVKRHGDVRRAKLYYLRKLSGKKARIKEKLPSRVAKKA